MRYCLFVTSFVFIINGQFAAGQKEIVIGVIYEKQQSDIPALVSEMFKDIEKKNEDQYKIIDQYIDYNREYVNETFNQLCQMMNDGVSILIDLSWSKWDDISQRLHEENIPYIHVDITIGPFVSAVTKYLMDRGGDDAALIFQNEMEVDQAIYQIIIDSQLRVICLNGLDKSTAERMKRMRPIPNHYVIFADSAKLWPMFRLAERHKLIQRPDRWNLMILDFKNERLHYNVNDYPNISVLMPNMDMCCKRLEKRSGCRCPNGFRLTDSMLREILEGILKTIHSNDGQIRYYNCNLNGTSSTDSLITDNVSDQFSDLFAGSTTIEITNLSLGPILNISVINGVQIPLTEQFESRVVATITNTDSNVNNFNVTVIVSDSIRTPRRFFRIGVTEAIPWSMMKRDPVTGETILDEDGKPIWYGYCIDFADTLAHKLNVDYELVPPTRGTFGRRLPDHSWTGLVGDLVSGEIDIAVAPLKMYAEREEVIDFIAPYFEQTGIAIVIRKPVRETSLFKFMTVLRLEVWLSIVGALCSTAVMIWLLDKYSPYSARNNKAAYPYPCRDFTLKESFWFALTSFTPQGGGEAPKALSGRTLVAAYWLFVVLMLATFTANLAAFLTVERMQTPVQSLEQLARQNRINYTVVEGSHTHEYFINMKFAEDTLYRVWKEITLNSTTDQAKYRVWDYPIREQYGQILLAINSSNPVSHPDEGFRNVNDHEDADYAFIHDAAEVKYELSRNCNLTEVGEVFAEQPYAIAVQQGSQYQDRLSQSILELQNERYFELLTAKYWNHSTKGECENNDDNEGITLESLGGVFIATLFGLALAMVTLVFEVIYYRRKKIRTKITQVQPIDSGGREPRPACIRPDDPAPPYESPTEVRVQFGRLKRRRLSIPTDVTFGTEFIPMSQRLKFPYNRSNLARKPIRILNEWNFNN